MAGSCSGRWPRLGPDGPQQGTADEESIAGYAERPCARSGHARLFGDQQRRGTERDRALQIACDRDERRQRPLLHRSICVANHAAEGLRG